MQGPFVVKVSGQSCDYYLGRSRMGFLTGVMNRSEAERFPTEEDARLAGQWAYQNQRIGNWEIKRENQA